MPQCANMIMHSVSILTLITNRNRHLPPPPKTTIYENTKLEPASSKDNKILEINVP